MILTTKTKVALAAIAYRAVATLRGIAGKKDCATVRRDGIRWSLDLSEGIDFSIYLLGGFERATAKTLQRMVQHGDTIFDIGANIGAHTLGLARSVGSTGRVFAFEPADFAFAKLKHNLALNPELGTRTRAYQILLAAELSAPPHAEIYASWPLQPNAAVHPKHRGRLVTAQHASVDTLDHFSERENLLRLDLMKIDVDGQECQVLKGGHRTLAKFRPTLVMEITPYVHAEHGKSFGELIALLRDAGYSLQDATTWKPLPMRAAELEARIPEGAGINVIARAAGSQ